MTPLDNLSKLFAGRSPLPAGAVPLATDAPASCVCLMPYGQWIRWWPGTRTMQSLPPETQRDVMAVVVAVLGGTAAAAGERLGVSSRTIDAWRSGKAPLPVKAAFLIGFALDAPLPRGDGEG